MGVKGLSSFVASDDDFSEYVLLSDINVVVDGFNLLHELYYNSNADAAYGGDYDIFAKDVDNYLLKLRSAHVSAYFIFDGAFEPDDKKLATVLSRARERIHLASLASHRKRTRILPILAYKVFIGKLKEYAVPCCVCDFEADAQIASLANAFECPIISNDSDFLLMPISGGIIRIDDLDVRKLISVEEEGETTKHLAVKIYKYQKLLQKFKMKSVHVLPSISLLCGNDVFPPKKLCHFTDTIKLNGKESKIATYLKFLAQYDSVENVTDAMLGGYNAADKTRMLRSIRLCLDGYRVPDNHIYSYLKEGSIQHGEPACFIYGCMSLPFWENFRNAEITHEIINALLFKRVILPCQMERQNCPSSWQTSKRIRQVLYGILSQSTKKLQFVNEYDRKGRELVQARVMPAFNIGKLKLPTLAVVASMEAGDKHKLLFTLLGVVDKDLRDSYLWSDEHRLSIETLLAVIIYWADQADPHVSDLHVMSVLVGFIKMTLVDSLPFEDPARQSVRKYAHKPDRDQKHKDGIDFQVIHGFAQFQATLYDVLDLMNLLNMPFDLPLHKIFSGRYAYNLMLELMKRPNPHLYCEELLLRGSPYSHLFSAWYSCIQSNVQPDSIVRWLPTAQAKSLKKRLSAKKKPATVAKPFVRRDSSSSSNDEHEDDMKDLGNNMFALLLKD